MTYNFILNYFLEFFPIYILEDFIILSDVTGVAGEFCSIFGD